MPYLYSPGDHVVALTFLVHYPFQARFAGSCVVLKQVSKQYYGVSTPERMRSTQLFHVNLLRSYPSTESRLFEVGVAAWLQTRC